MKFLFFNFIFMSLKDQIQQDLMTAMKAREEIKVGAIRMLKAAISKWEVEGTKKEANDEVVLTILKKEIKQRKEAAEQYKIGHRPELAEKEELESQFLSVYLPAQLSEEEVKQVVEKVLGEMGGKEATDFGKLMGASMKELKGKADGALVSKVVKEVLS